MIKKNNNNKGNTLVEVIVSIVIISLLVGMLLTVFVQSKRVQSKLNSENLYITEINNLYNIFKSDPSEFDVNLISVYSNISKDENNNFVLDIDKSSYLLLTYTSEDGLYNLTINLYKDNLLVEKYSKLTKSIIDREEN